MYLPLGYLLPLLPALYAQQIPLSSSDPALNTGPIYLESEPYYSKYGLQRDLGFTGPLSFSHLPYTKCLEDPHTPSFDIAVLGFPFDTAVSYRPGARFGPSAIRHGSRRQIGRGYTLSWSADPWVLGSAVRDCGDVPLAQTDNMKALDQMEAAYSSLLSRPVAGGEGFSERTRHFALDDKEHPRIVTLGGDHTIVLPILRSLNKVYGPVSVIHFDAHIDTWSPERYNSTGAPMSEQERITHGSFFSIAHGEGLIKNDSSIHAGIRCKFGGLTDVEHDYDVGFSIISTDDLDDYGISQVIAKMRERIGDSPVYLSFDIDTLDPGLAPATGTPEAGGWTTREVKRILRGLAGLNFVGADLVEVAPAYDHADITSIAAADLVHDFLVMMQIPSPPVPHKRGPWAH